MTHTHCLHNASEGPLPFSATGLLPLWVIALALAVSPLRAQQTELHPALVISPSLDELINLMHERLSWMRELAGWKWGKSESLQEPGRDAELLAQLSRQATNLGFEAESIRRIFQIQFDMAGAIQEYWHNRWHLSGFPADWKPQDPKQIYPRLNRLARQILVAIYLRVPALREPEGKRLPDLHRLTELPLEPALVFQLEQAFKGLELLPLHKVGLLKRVQSSGLLRVGSTGDYPPFSTREGEWWGGIDLEMANLLAKSIQAQVAVVPTTWARLESDLIDGHFDIAMSGIDVTRHRSRQGYFSDSYYQGGKQLLGRCADRGVLTSLKMLDREGIKIAVSAGSTDETYAKDNIRRAQVLILKDNQEAFGLLENNQADAMIADAVEVQWQSRLHPLLCALSDRLLTKSRKAYLTHKDKDFVGEVDVWLERLRRSGQLQRILNRHLYPDSP